MTTSIHGAENVLARPRATRGQTFVGAFCALLLLGALAVSATATLACAGLSACHNGGSGHGDSQASIGPIVTRG